MVCCCLLFSLIWFVTMVSGDSYPATIVLLSSIGLTTLSFYPSFISRIVVGKMELVMFVGGSLVKNDSLVGSACSGSLRWASAKSQQSASATPFVRCRQYPQHLYLTIRFSPVSFFRCSCRCTSWLSRWESELAVSN